jgi:hypothetical protein
MRFMAMIKGARDHEAGAPPNPELMAAMDKLRNEMTALGKFEMGGGLLPSSQGHKVQMSGGKVHVTDGPFAETKEVIGGFAILHYDSHEEAIAGARRVLQIHADCGITDLEIEIRPMFDMPAGH